VIATPMNTAGSVGPHAGGEIHDAGPESSVRPFIAKYMRSGAVTRLTVHAVSDDTDDLAREWLAEVDDQPFSIGVAPGAASSG